MSDPGEEPRVRGMLGHAERKLVRAFLAKTRGGSSAPYSIAPVRRKATDEHRYTQMNRRERCADAF